MRYMDMQVSKSLQSKAFILKVEFYTVLGVIV
jgi:hypothetical protein